VEGDWVNVQLSVRRTDRHFVVRLADREEIVEKGDEDQVAQLAEVVFKSVEEYLETDFESFLEGAEREGPRESIGFTRS
jgi:hypothetical protein